MAISLSYLPSNALSAYIQAQTGVASQNANTTTPDPLAAAQNTSTTPQTDTSQSGTASVITQLSVPGQVKATLADLQDKAAALKSLSTTPNISDFQVIVQGFTQAFNSLNQNIKALVSKQNSTDNRPSQALYDVRKAAAGDNGNSLAALQKLGVAPQANGTLSVNQHQLANSYQNNHSETVATISALANRVAQATERNLSGNAAEAQIASSAAPYGNVAETQVSSGTTDSQFSGSTAGSHLPDNTVIDKTLNDVNTHVSQPENTGSTTKSSTETHTQLPAQSPAPSSPPVQTPAPVSNTAHTAVATYTSVAAI